MKFAFIIDPIDKFNIDRDSSFFLMLASQKRDYEVWITEQKDLWAFNNNVFAKMQKIKVERNYNKHYEILEEKVCDLSKFSAVFMRKDPPFNMEYIHTTYLLSIIKDKTLVINDPDGIRKANEKIFILDFPEIITDTIVTKSKEVILEFLSKSGGKVVLKPLDRRGGEGIFILKEGDKNLHALIDISTDYGNTTIMVQKYIEEAEKGDKRIIIIKGEPMGAFLRIPSQYDHRGNLCAGAQSVKTEMTDRDLEICETLKQKLIDLGLVFVGIDVLGNYLSEINVTSPTGLQEIANMYNIHIEDRILDNIEEYYKVDA